MSDFFVYVMTNWNNEVLYIGVSSDLEGRVWQHKNKIFEGFTEKYNVTKLVYYEQFHDPVNAIEREKQLKKWARSKKDVLVNKMNSEWKDLSLDWYRKDPSTALGMTAQEAD